MKILIVEDDSSSQLLLQTLLADYGTCELAANGQEAVEAIEQAIVAGEPYDLICMDIMMPQMDGLEALQKIRQTEFKHYQKGLVASKVIMTTAKDMAKDITSAFKAGCGAYITKPINKKELFEQIHLLGLLDSPCQPDSTD